MKELKGVLVFFIFLVGTIAFIIEIGLKSSSPVLGVYGGVGILLVGIFIAYYMVTDYDRPWDMVGVLFLIYGFLGSGVFMIYFAYKNPPLAVFGMVGIIISTVFITCRIFHKGTT